MSNYAHHHADSGSDLDEIEDEHAQLVTGRSLNDATANKVYSQTSTPAPFHSPVLAAAAARLEKLPLCCCRLTPFVAFVLLLFGIGFALLIPGILMRLESIASPVPLILFQLCRQPSSYAQRALDAFRNEVGVTGSTAAEELKYEGLSLSTSALSVYRGSNLYQCAEEEAYDGSPQAINLPDTLLYTGVQYVAFLTLPVYVVGGSVSMRLYSGDELLFNVTTSLHLHRYLGLHDVHWLESSQTADTFTHVYNPHLSPAPIHAHGVREEDCRFPAGCTYRLRAGMQSLILTSTSFTLPTPVLTPEEEAKQEAEANARATAEMYGEVPEEISSTIPRAQRVFQQDESMLIYATNLTLIIDQAEVIESNQLAERDQAHVPGPHEPYVYHGSSSGEEATQPRQAPTRFISPDILLSFHQYQLSPMQHVGVSYIIRGSIMLLAAIAIAYVKWSNDQQRERPKHS